MNNIVKDLESAKEIIDKGSFISFSDKDKIFNEHSYVYRATNEMINTEPYIKVLKDKKKILSVVASGDQILNSILYGSKDIDAFDISVFPKYYLELKKAGINALSKEEFIDFFLGEVSNYKKNTKTFNIDTYSELRKYLPENYKFFWDNLFFDKVYGNSFPKFILNSNFFDSPYSRVGFSILYNPYLNGENYELLKRKINDVNINYFEGNIFDLGPELKKEYDLINLSSIFIANSIGKLDIKYDEFFKKLSLSEKGIILSYIFQYNIDVYKFYNKNIIPNDNHYEFERLKDDEGYVQDGIVTYCKTLK